jgi:hypothetical protein
MVVVQLYLNFLMVVVQLYLNCLMVVVQLYLNCLMVVVQLYLNCLMVVVQVRVPSASHRPNSPRRSVHPMTNPFPMAMGGGLEMAYALGGGDPMAPRDAVRAKKVK